MSQHSMTIANNTGAAVRADLNSALQALVGNSSGSTSPTTTFAFQFWADTSSDTLRMRNSANTAWIAVMTMSTGVSLSAATASSVTTNAVVTGVVMSGTNPKFSAYLPTTNQSVTSGSPTKVSLSAVEFNVGTMFDGATNHRFTPTIAGYYRFAWGLGMAASGLTAAISMLYKNGSIYKQGSFVNGGSPGFISTFLSSGSALVSMNGSTDYVELYGNVSGSSGTLFIAANYDTYLTGELIP